MKIRKFRTNGNRMDIRPRVVSYLNLCVSS